MSATAPPTFADPPAADQLPTPARVALPTDPWLQARLPSLDGLRFVAAVLVIVYHGGVVVPAPDGVTFFFVLSGFLFSVLFDRELRRTGTIALVPFYARRAIRIFPAFYTALAITIVGKLWTDNPVNWSHAAASGLFVGNYFNAFHNHPPTGFAHFWSLAVEEQFYLVWPLMFLVLARRRRSWLLGGLAAAIIGVGAWRTIGLWSGRLTDPYAYNAFDCRFDSLAVGCLLGLLVASPRFRKLVGRTCPTGWEPGLLIAGLVWSASQSAAFHSGPGFTVDSLLMGLLLLQLIALGAHPLWRWLNWGPIRFLGTLSYSAYLLHPWGLACALKTPGLSAGLRPVVGVVVTMLLAWLLYWFVERPTLGWRERFRVNGARLGPARG